MGSGIAQVSAVAGHQVVLHDSNQAACDRAARVVATSLSRLVKKGTLSERKARDALGRITLTDDIGPFSEAEVVIEAVFEDIDVKRKVWGEISIIVLESAILASNTSSLSITEIASFTSHPQRFCGMHFFNPVAILPLVEVVRGLTTSEAVVTEAQSFVKGLGKRAIVCQDRPGFIVNRLLVPYINDAIHALSEGVASAEDIDEAMKLGANMPIGPLALADLVGLDVALAAAESLYREFGDSKFRVAPLLRQLVRAGRLGRKTGQGFYSYP